MRNNWIFASAFVICFAGFMFFISTYNMPWFLRLPAVMLISGIIMTFTSKVKVTKSIFTVTITFLIPLTIMHFSSYLVEITIYDKIDTIISDLAFILLQIGLNLFIYYYYPVWKGATIIFKDWRAAFILLFFLLAFSSFAYSMFTLEYNYKLFTIYFILIFASATGLVGFLSAITKFSRDYVVHECLVAEKLFLTTENQYLIEETKELKELNNEMDAEMHDIRIYRSTVSHDVANLMPDKIKHLIHKTGWQEIDDFFESCRSQCSEKKIKLTVCVMENLNWLEKNKIDKTSILIIMLNLVKNSINALNTTDIENKKVNVYFRLTSEGVYYISISDNAREFDLEVLTNLVERNSGKIKNGHGLTNALKAMKKYDASLLITEYEAGKKEFTKCLSVIFDEKNNRELDSRRVELITDTWDKEPSFDGMDFPIYQM